MKTINMLGMALVAILLTYSVSFSQSCDTLRNFIKPANNTYTTWTSNGDGLLLGQDEIFDGTDTYETDVWVEPYNIGTQSNQIRAVRMLPWKIKNASNNGKITLRVYNASGNQPGTQLYSQVVPFSSLKPEMYWSQIELTTPISVTGKFFVGYEVTFTSPVDSFALATTQPTSNFTLFHLSGPIGSYFYNQWKGVNEVYSSNGTPINSAFAFEVLLSNGTKPVADFSIDNDEVCLSGHINVDASASTGTIDTYNWLITDDDVTQFYVDFYGNAIDQVGPSQSSPQNQSLFLLVNGACHSDATGYYIKVYPDVTATVTPTDAHCGNNGSITITNASGGKPPYLYSSDGGVNTQSGNTFNLPANSYNTQVIADGNGCVYSQTVTINNVPGETLTLGATPAPICAGNQVTLTASGNGTITWYIGVTQVGTGASYTASPATTTTYDVKLTDGNGCVDSKQITVTVNPSADATFNYSSNTFCSGGSNVTPIISQSGGVFSSTSGLVFVNTATGEIDVTASADGQYTVTYTISGTCGDTKTQNITITSAPNASFTYSNNAYCQNEGTVSPIFNGGSAGLFSSTNGLNINSNTGVITTNSSVPGSYTVTNTIAASGSCPQAVETFNITINGLPAVDAGQDQTLCTYNNAIILNGTPNGGTFSGQGVTNNSFDPSIGIGTYTITYTYNDGTCENSATMTITVDGCASVDANNLNTNVTIHPNPATSHVDVVTGNLIVKELQVVTTDGKIITTDISTIDSHTIRINTSSIVKGMYIIQISTENGVLSRKVLVQ
ncbi:MAG: T9SS type A sorting domain-containing protein [Brumimicrobium sp.]|nr:T9SS type A sorting domain-containing protein [Brumimicrobium sp.]